MTDISTPPFEETIPPAAPLPVPDVPGIATDVAATTEGGSITEAPLGPVTEPADTSAGSTDLPAGREGFGGGGYDDGIPEGDLAAIQAEALTTTPAEDQQAIG